MKKKIKEYLWEMNELQWEEKENKNKKGEARKKMN